MTEPANKPHAAMSGETPGIDADLDKLQRDTFGYFLHEANPANGLVTDKTAKDWALFLELATEDLVQAAGLLRPIHDATGGVDGWVSLEVSPLLADDSGGSLEAAAELHARAQRPNLFIKIPGTCAGIPREGTAAFAKSWNELMRRIASKRGLP